MIKIGLCGAGFMGKMHAACYASIPEVKVAAVADVRKEEAAKAAPGAQYYAKAMDLIKKADVDMIDVCLPTYLHAEHVIAAAGRGVDCMCEKPLALNVEQAAAMVKAIKKARIKFMTGHVIRFWPEYTLLKEYIDTKKLGAIKTLLLRRFAARPSGWQNWFTRNKLSGGAILDLHCHDVDYVLHLFGKPSGVDTVGAPVDGYMDQVCTNYAYPKVAVTAAGGWWPDGEPFEMSFRAVFEKGALIYSSRIEPLTLYTPGAEPKKLDVPQPKTGSVDAGGNVSTLGGYFNETKYFIDCIKAGKHPRTVTPEDALETVRLVYRELASAQKKLRK